MKELLRTINSVELSIMQKVLNDHDIETLVLDRHTGGALPAIGGAMEMRLVVLDDDRHEDALSILKREGLLS